MTAHYTPILAGVAQYTQPKDVERPLDPMGLMVRVCRAARTWRLSCTVWA